MQAAHLQAIAGGFRTLRKSLGCLTGKGEGKGEHLGITEQSDQLWFLVLKKAFYGSHQSNKLKGFISSETNEGGFPARSP